MKTLEELLVNAKNSKPLIEDDGVKVVPLEDFMDLNYTESLSGEKTGIRKLNPDGSIARSRTKYAAVNKEFYYDNRYFVNEEDEFVVVIPSTSDDAYLAVKAMSDGKMPPKKVVPAFQFSRGLKNQVVLDKPVMISDEKFIANFTHKLDKDAMEKILEALKKNVKSATNEDKLPI